MGMSDKEKVIKGLEYCKKYGALGGNDCNGHYEYTDNLRDIIKANNHRKDCLYGQCKAGCVVTLIDDALFLLKEQEAELSYRKAKVITHTATKLDDATCPSCGNVVGEKIRTGAIGQSVVQVRWDYCRFCGQKLDWEGR